MHYYIPDTLHTSKLSLNRDRLRQGCEENVMLLALEIAVGATIFFVWCGSNFKSVPSKDRAGRPITKLWLHCLLKCWLLSCEHFEPDYKHPITTSHIQLLIHMPWFWSYYLLFFITYNDIIFSLLNLHCVSGSSRALPNQFCNSFSTVNEFLVLRSPTYKNQYRWLIGKVYPVNQKICRKM